MYRIPFPAHISSAFCHVEDLVSNQRRTIDDTQNQNRQHAPERHPSGSLQKMITRSDLVIQKQVP